MSGPDWPSSAELLEQEQRLALPGLDNAAAVDLGLCLLELARSRSLPVVLEVRRLGQVAFRAALPGSGPDNDDWVAGKARIVERFGHSSLHERRRHEEKGTDFTTATGLDAQLFRAHGGGFPLTVAGTGCVGVAIVSGLPQLEDHALVVEALEAYLAGLTVR